MMTGVEVVEVCQPLVWHILHIRTDEALQEGSLLVSFHRLLVLPPVLAALYAEHFESLVSFFVFQPSSA